MGPAGRLPRGRRDGPPGGHPRDARGDRAVVEPGEIIGLYTRLEAAVVTIAFEARVVGGTATPTPRGARDRHVRPGGDPVAGARVPDDDVDAARLARPAAARRPVAAHRPGVLRRSGPRQEVRPERDPAHQAVLAVRAAAAPRSRDIDDRARSRSVDGSRRSGCRSSSTATRNRIMSPPGRGKRQLEAALEGDPVAMPAAGRVDGGCRDRLAAARFEHDPHQAGRSGDPAAHDQLARGHDIAASRRLIERQVALTDRRARRRPATLDGRDARRTGWPRAATALCCYRDDHAEPHDPAGERQGSASAATAPGGSTRARKLVPPAAQPGPPDAQLMSMKTFLVSV